MPIIEITLIEGRTQDQKQALAEKVTDAVEEFSGRSKGYRADHFAGSAQTSLCRRGCFQGHTRVLLGRQPNFLLLLKKLLSPGYTL